MHRRLFTATNHFKPLQKKMVQLTFAENVRKIIAADASVIGLAVAGSWLTAELDAFSDLDLILVTKEKIAPNKTRMLNYAKQFGQLLSGFTGEHLGEPRLLICLYNNPLLHVDIKFLTLDEFQHRIETPVILHDTNNQLQNALANSTANFPLPDFQWMEDRFWIWVHYALLKIGRGEYLEAFDFFSFLRMAVLGPLLLLKNDSLPRGVRKAEMQLPQPDLEKLISTVPAYRKDSLLTCLQHAVTLYRELRTELFNSKITLQIETEERVMQYFTEIIATN